MALTGIPTNRTSIDLPVDVSNEILQKTQESSAIMRLARQITLPGRGAAINVITSDPEASWVGETGSKPVSNPGLETKVMRAYKLAVIVPFSDEFARDAQALYDAIIERLPGALAKKFDATVFGTGSKPGSDFDNFAGITAQSLASDAYAGLVAADTDVALHGGVINGYAISPQMRGILLGAEDTSHRPIFINNVSEGAIPRLLGQPVLYSKGLYKAGSAASGATAAVPDLIGVAGDWTKALYGTVEGVKIDISTQATLTIGTSVVNLWEHNMFAVKAEIEVGFVADTYAFNRIVRAHA